eukprot:4048639-Pyramimonas_sp.AAC.2
MSEHTTKQHAYAHSRTRASTHSCTHTHTRACVPFYTSVRTLGHVPGCAPARAAPPSPSPLPAVDWLARARSACTPRAAGGRPWRGSTAPQRSCVMFMSRTRRTVRIRA